MNTNPFHAYRAPSTQQIDAISDLRLIARLHDLLDAVQPRS